MPWIVRPGAELPSGGVQVPRITIQYRDLGNIAPVVGGILGSAAAGAAAGKCTRSFWYFMQKPRKTTCVCVC